MDKAELLKHQELQVAKRLHVAAEEMRYALENTVAPGQPKLKRRQLNIAIKEMKEFWTQANEKHRENK